jgi:hypothetical protein
VPTRLFAGRWRKSKEPFDRAQDKQAGRPSCVWVNRRYERWAWSNSLIGAVSLEGGQGADGADYVFGLGQDCVFEFGLVGAEGVGGRDAADRSVEVFE